MRRLLVLCAGVVLAIGVGAAPVAADAPRDQGWWTAANPVPAPDVPARGLLVQAGVSGPPTAFAALV